MSCFFCEKKKSKSLAIIGAVSVCHVPKTLLSLNLRAIQILHTFFHELLEERRQLTQMSQLRVNSLQSLVVFNHGFLPSYYLVGLF